MNERNGILAECITVHHVLYSMIEHSIVLFTFSLMERRIKNILMFFTKNSTYIPIILKLYVYIMKK